MASNLGLIFDIYESHEGSRYIRESRNYAELANHPALGWVEVMNATRKIADESRSPIDVQFVDMGRYPNRYITPSNKSFYQAMLRAALTLRNFNCIVTICGKFDFATTLFEAGRFNTYFPQLRISFSKLFFDNDFAVIVDQLVALNVGVQVMLDFSLMNGDFHVKLGNSFLRAADPLRRAEDLSKKYPDLTLHGVSIDCQGRVSPDERLLMYLDRFAAHSGLRVYYSGGVQLNADLVNLRSNYPNIEKYFVGNAMIRHFLNN